MKGPEPHADELQGSCRDIAVDADRSRGKQRATMPFFKYPPSRISSRAVWRIALILLLVILAATFLIGGFLLLRSL
jgi:hypothetical protein